MAPARNAARSSASAFVVSPAARHATGQQRLYQGAPGKVLLFFLDLLIIATQPLVMLYWLAITEMVSRDFMGMNPPPAFPAHRG